MARARIYIEAKEVGGFTEYGHLYLVFKSDSGTERVIRGGPSSGLVGGFIELEINEPLEESEDARGNDTPAERGLR